MKISCSDPATSQTAEVAVKTAPIPGVAKLIFFFAILLLLYALNYFVTPIILGVRALESSFRPGSSQPFDSKVWKDSGLILNGGIGKWSPSYGRRYAMIDDLLAKHLVVGMEASDVSRILGNPDAGLTDKRELEAELSAVGNQSGLFDRSPAKEILRSPDDIAYWAYHLGSQQQYPARSMWFPGVFANGEGWKLLVKIKDGKVDALSITF